MVGDRHPVLIQTFHMSAQYGCHLTYIASIEGATWGVVRAFWLPNGASVRRLIRRAPLTPQKKGRRVQPYSCHMAPAAIRYLQPLIGPEKDVSNVPLVTGADHTRCDPARPGKAPICFNRTPNSVGAGGPGNPSRWGFQRMLTIVPLNLPLDTKALPLCVQRPHLPARFIQALR